MPSPTLQILAPAFHLPAHSDAEAFGTAAWLWMHGDNHQNLPLLALDRMLLPAIRLRQYAMLLEVSAAGSRPVAYLGWANLNADAEARYLQKPVDGLRAEDWNSGDRMWFTDFFAPFGHSKAVRALLAPHMAGISARYLYHRSHERGVRVMTYTGTKVDPAYARQWWTDRPILAASGR